METERKKLKLNKNYNIPNLLSFLRILIIPAIVKCFVGGNILLSAILIICSAITDIVDGFIARKFNMITELGKALDPIADKLTLFFLMICLCCYSKFMFILLVVFTIKEILMAMEGLIIIKKIKKAYSSKWFGKITTALLYFAMFLHFIFKNIDYKISYILILTCIAMVILSFILYTAQNLKRIKNEK